MRLVEAFDLKGAPTTRGSEATWNLIHGIKKTTTTSDTTVALLLLLIDFVLEGARMTVLCTITEKCAVLAVDDMMALVADSDTYGAHSCVASQPTSVAVIPVLVFILLPRSQESTCVLWPAHVLGIVSVTVIECELFVAV